MNATNRFLDLVLLKRAEEQVAAATIERRHYTKKANAPHANIPTTEEIRKAELKRAEAQIQDLEPEEVTQ